MLSQIEQYRKADRCFIKAMEKDPKCAAIYANRSLLHMRIDNVDKAVEYINKAIEIDGKYGRAYGALGIIEVKRYVFSVIVPNNCFRLKCLNAPT